MIMGEIMPLTELKMGRGYPSTYFDFLIECPELRAGMPPQGSLRSERTEV